MQGIALRFHGAEEPQEGEVREGEVNWMAGEALSQHTRSSVCPKATRSICAVLSWTRLRSLSAFQCSNSFLKSSRLGSGIVSTLLLTLCVLLRRVALCTNHPEW